MHTNKQTNKRTNKLRSFSSELSVRGRAHVPRRSEVALQQHAQHLRTSLGQVGGPVKDDSTARGERYLGAIRAAVGARTGAVS
ncbi:hypothetical protein NFJ02_09g143020 [Pycnococcus provasolii]